jgi:hypothetical protein
MLHDEHAQRDQHSPIAAATSLASAAGRSVPRDYVPQNVR